MVNACPSCAKQRIPCQHPALTFCDKIKELKHKRNLKPFILVMSLNVLLEFSGAICWRPYIIQVIKAYGIPMNVNTVAMILGSTSIVGGLCFLLCVKMFGKRRLYLTSTAIVVVCCIALGKINPHTEFFLNLNCVFLGRHLWHRFLSGQLDII